MKKFFHKKFPALIFLIFIFSLVAHAQEEFSLGVQTQVKPVGLEELNDPLQVQSAVGDFEVPVQEVNEQLDLLEEKLVTKPLPEIEDRDQDGISDDWESLYFGYENEKANDPVRVQSYMRQLKTLGVKDNFPRLRIMSNGTVRPDSDGDGLSDALEFQSGTHPLQSDTDRDGIDDAVELVEGMNPIKVDSDSDTFPDFVELSGRSDPNDSASFPLDENSNGVGDEYEEKYALAYADDESPGSKDTDSDGVSDRLEYYYGSDPTKADTDEDSLSDFEELFYLSTDVLVADVPGYLGVRITNWMFEEQTSDNRPLFQGVARENELVQLVIDDNKGTSAVIGEGRTADNGRFLLQPAEDVQNGFFTFLVQEIDNQGAVLRKSNRVQLKINSEIDLQNPNIEKIDEVRVDPLIRDLQIKIVNQKPLVTGKVFPGARVNAFWQSTLLASSMLVDYDGEDFAISPPENLAPASHTVTLYAMDTDSSSRSENASLNFEVTGEGDSTQGASTLTTDNEQDGMPISEAPPAENSFYIKVVIGVGVLLILAILIFFFKKKTKGIIHDDKE